MNSTGQAKDGKAKLALSFEPGVPQEVGINGAVDDRETKPGNEDVFELLPDMGSAGFAVFHEIESFMRLRVCKDKPGDSVGERRACYERGKERFIEEKAVDEEPCLDVQADSSATLMAGVFARSERERKGAGLPGPE